MQLCRKNNIIINAAEHKEKIEANHSHIETLGLVEDQGKTHYGEHIFKFFFLLNLHWMVQQKRAMIHIFIHTTIYQQQLNNIHEMNPTMLILKKMIQKLVINFHCLRSNAEHCGQLPNITVNWQKSRSTEKPNPRSQLHEESFVHAAKTLNLHA